VVVQCIADTIVVNQPFVFRINFLVKIATFAKPKTVAKQPSAQTFVISTKRNTLKNN
jgi:hypothetical protein